MLILGHFPLNFYPWYQNSYIPLSRLNSLTILLQPFWMVPKGLKGLNNRPVFKHSASEVEGAGRQ